MKEVPILFNTEMVQAILNGRKTVTRRVVKQDIVNRFDIDVEGKVIAYIDQSTGDFYNPTDICKYKVGDIMWVRETFYKSPTHGGWRYMNEVNPSSPCAKSWKKMPSIHMPRSAARIFLKVTDVRVERLQDIKNTIKPKILDSGYKVF